MGQPAKRQSLPHSGSHRDRLRATAVLHSSHDPLRFPLSAPLPSGRTQAEDALRPSACDPTVCSRLVIRAAGLRRSCRSPQAPRSPPSDVSRYQDTRPERALLCSALCGLRSAAAARLAGCRSHIDGRRGATRRRSVDASRSGACAGYAARPAACGQWRHLAAGNSETTGNSEHSLCPRRSALARPPSATLVCDWAGLDECRYDANLCRARPPGRSASSTGTRCQAMAWSIQRNANAVA